MKKGVEGLKGKALILLAFIVGLIGIIYIFSLLYTASWWVYAVIYMLLFFLQLLN